MEKKAMFTVYCLEVVIEAATPLALDRYCGSALRGAFFRALWERFCTNRESPTCEECPLVTACPVTSLLAPLRDEAPRGRNVPRPYIITAPYRGEGETNYYKPGETFTFGLALIGNIAKLYPYVVRAFQVMEQNNLGHPLTELRGRRGKILIREIRSHHPITDERQILWQQGEKRPEPLQLCVTSDDIASRAKQLPTDHLTIDFLSPTRLIANEHVLTRPHFSTLVMRLAQRLEEIQQEYGSPMPGTNEGNEEISGREWYLSLKEKATHVQLEHDETQWADVQSYSARQKRSTPIGGIVGRASFVGDVSQFRELLTWGEILHVGKNIVKGGGTYRIET
jgi:CRISPR-associated endoribonuclease Cas6